MGDAAGLGVEIFGWYVSTVDLLLCSVVLLGLMARSWGGGLLLDLSCIVGGGGGSNPVKSGVRLPELLTWIEGEKFSWLGLEFSMLLTGGGEKVMALIVLLSSFVYMGDPLAMLPMSKPNPRLARLEVEFGSA